MRIRHVTLVTERGFYCSTIIIYETGMWPLILTALDEIEKVDILWDASLWQHLSQTVVIMLWYNLDTCFIGWGVSKVLNNLSNL